LSRFRRAAAITTWLFAIVRNHCFHLHQRGVRGPERALADQMLSDVERSDPAQDARLRHLFSRALASLEPWQREVILMRDVEGLPAPEAAQQSGVTVQALKSRLHRAREELRRLLAEEIV